MIPTLLAQFGLGLASAILFISALSFLGVGIQPPAADLGALVRENALALSGGRMTPLFSGLPDRRHVHVHQRRGRLSRRALLGSP
jgi:ABC-type dipeptide/oligopeptide/nickel transport system permease subunit